MGESIENERLFVACWILISCIPFLFGIALASFESLGIITIIDIVLVVTLILSSILSFFALMGLLCLFEYFDNQFEKRVKRIIKETK